MLLYFSTILNTTLLLPLLPPLHLLPPLLQPHLTSTTPPIPATPTTPTTRQAQPFFCLSWVLTWFSHNFDRFDDVVTVYDFLLGYVTDRDERERQDIKMLVLLGC